MLAGVRRRSPFGEFPILGERASDTDPGRTWFTHRPRRCTTRSSARLEHLLSRGSPGSCSCPVARELLACAMCPVGGGTAAITPVQLEQPKPGEHARDHGALGAHYDIKPYVVDTDVDVHDPTQVEWRWHPFPADGIDRGSRSTGFEARPVHVDGVGRRGWTHCSRRGEGVHPHPEFPEDSWIWSNWASSALGLARPNRTAVELPCGTSQ